MLRDLIEEASRWDRDEVHVAVAQATDMSRAEMLAIMDALEHCITIVGFSSCHFIGRDEQCRLRRTGNPQENLAQ